MTGFGFGGLANSAHAQVVGSATLSVSQQLTTLQKTLDAVGLVLDSIGQGIAEHTIPRESYPVIGEMLDGLKTTLLSVRSTVATLPSAPLTQGNGEKNVSSLSANAGTSVFGGDATEHLSAQASVPNPSLADQQTASVGLVAQHGTLSVIIGIVLFLLVLGAFLVLRSRLLGEGADSKKSSAKVVESAAVSKTDQA